MCGGLPFFRNVLSHITRETTGQNEYIHKLKLTEVKKWKTLNAPEPINCSNTDTNAVMSLLEVCIVTLLNNIDSRVKKAKNVNETRDKSFCQTYAKSLHL